MRPILVPLVRQAQPHSSGAACLASCLYYFGVWDGREAELYPTLDADETGKATKQELWTTGHFLGLKIACYKTDCTLGQLQTLQLQGFTIILPIQAWADHQPHDPGIHQSYDPIRLDDDLSDQEVYQGTHHDWEATWNCSHCVVLVSIESDHLVVMDPAIPGRYGSISKLEFVRRWHDIGDDGKTKEYHGALILKGEEAIDRHQLVTVR